MKPFCKCFLFVSMVAMIALIDKEGMASSPAARPENPATGGDAYTLAETAPVDLDAVPTIAALSAEFNRLSAAVVPSVVSIISTRTIDHPQLPERLERFFGEPPGELEFTALGSGVIISKEGHIITNFHIVAEVDEIEVRLNDGRTSQAQKIASDPITDIAILKIDMANLVPLPLGDSGQVKVGDIVFAIGNPFGLQESVTNGIVSATERRVTRDVQIDFLQTTAEINPGNSGGPLINLRGEIIGINTAIAAAGDAGWQGIGFAIPSNTVRQGLDSLIEHGRIIRGYLGVIIQEITEELARQFDLATTEGALVAGVAEDSPAQRAGIQPGDIIVRFNDHAISEFRDLRRHVTEAEVGSQAELEVIRDGERITLTAQIAEMPMEEAS